MPFRRRPLSTCPPLAALLLSLAFLGRPAVTSAQAPPATIAGRITGPEGHGAAGSTVIAIDELGRTVEAKTGTDGGFRLRLPAGSYTVTIDGRRLPDPKPLVAFVGDSMRLDVRIQTDRTLRAASWRLSAGVFFGLGDGNTQDLPLDRSDAGAAVLDLAPGVARGAAFGAAAGIGTPQRVDGLDLTDPLDGQAWTTFVLPAVTVASVRSGVGVQQRDASGAVLDVVTRAGGTALHGVIDVVGGGRAWTRDTLPDDLLSANARLVDRDRAGRALRAAGVLSGPLGPRLGFGLAVEHADEARAGGSQAVMRTPRMHGRLVWGAGEERLGIVGFVDRTSITRDVPLAAFGYAAPGLENRRTVDSVATRGTWQRSLKESLRLTASVDLLHGSRETTPTTDAPGRDDAVTGRLSGSLGVIQQGERTRTIAGAHLDWRTAAAGGHDVRIGGDVERTRVSEGTAFTGGEFFHDLAGRADTVDVWSGTTRDATLGRETLVVADTWTPTSRLSVEAGLRLAHLRASGGGDRVYSTTAFQPRVSATLAVDRQARLVAFVNAGVVADPLYAAHVERALPGETPLVTYQILNDGRRVEIARTVPTVARAASDIRHPDVREVLGGANVRLTSAVSAGGSFFVRRFMHAIGPVYPGARWLPQPRLGLTGQALSSYRWLNRQPTDAATIANTEGTTYLGSTGTAIDTALARREYIGVLGTVAVRLPGDRGSVMVAVTTADTRGTVDDTREAGLGNTDHFASPTAALGNADGPSTLTPNLELTVLGTARLPLVPVRVSAIYQRLSGAHYTAQRTFSDATLNVPFDAAGRTLRLEPRGARQLDPMDELSLRIASPLPFGKRRLEVYADVVNVLRRTTVVAVEAGSPFGTSSGTPLTFETPIEVQRPFRVLLGGRWSF
jgi:hypothetical protein